MPDTDVQNQTANPPVDDSNIEEQLDHSAQLAKKQLRDDPSLSQSLASTPQMQDLVIDVEEDLLREIIGRLDKDTLTQEKAQHLAKEFLSILPVNDQKDLLEKLKQLSNSNQEITGIYLKYAAPHEEQDRITKLNLITQHLQVGNIDQAIIIAKGGSSNG